MKESENSMRVKDLPIISGVDVRIFLWDDYKKDLYRGMFGDVPVDIRNREIKYIFPFEDCLILECFK